MFSSAFDAGIASPDAPNLLFVCGLSIVGKMGGGKSSGGPAELDPFFGLPAAQNGIEETSDKSISAADAVENADLAGLDDLPLAVDVGNRSPEMLVGGNHLTQGGSKRIGIGISRADALDHLFEVIDLARDSFSARLGTFDLEAELEVLLVSDQDIRETGDLGEDC